MNYSIQNWGDLNEEELISCLDTVQLPLFVKSFDIKSMDVNQDKIDMELNVNWSGLFYLITVVISLLSLFISHSRLSVFPLLIGLLILRSLYSYSKSVFINRLYLATKDKPQNNC